VVGVSGAGYRFAGGAPLYVSSWALFGNPAATRVDDYALDHYAAGGPLSHVLRYPLTGTFLKGLQTCKTYQDVSGVPKRVTTTTSTPVNIDQLAVDHAGQSGVWSHLR
jgi:hypothetical protein